MLCRAHIQTHPTADAGLIGAVDRQQRLVVEELVLCRAERFVARLAFGIEVAESAGVSNIFGAGIRVLAC